MRERLLKLADDLDKAGLIAEADAVDRFLKKMAQAPAAGGAPGQEQKGSLRSVKRNLERVFNFYRNLPDDISKVQPDQLRRLVKATFDQLNTLVDTVTAANPQAASVLKKVDTLVNQTTSI